MRNKNIPEVVTLLDLIAVSDWKDIYRVLMGHYPIGNKELEKHAFNVIKKYKKQPPRLKNEQIQITLALPYFDEKYLVPKDDRTGDWYHIATNKYSLSFRPWLEIANIPIAYKTIASYSMNEIVAHILWEITFYGDEQQMKETAEETNKSMKECIKELKEKEKQEKKK